MFEQATRHLTEIGVTPTLAMPTATIALVEAPRLDVSLEKAAPPA